MNENTYHSPILTDIRKQLLHLWARGNWEPPSFRLLDSGILCEDSYHVWKFRVEAKYWSILYVLDIAVSYDLLIASWDIAAYLLAELTMHMPTAKEAFKHSVPA